MKYIITALAVAVIIGAALFVSIPRYSIVPDTSAWQIWRVDARTGTVSRCHFVDGTPETAHTACYNRNRAVGKEATAK